MPLDRVTSRSADGRKLRRHVLRGAVVVFVTAGYSSKRFILERAKELGVRSGATWGRGVRRGANRLAPTRTLCTALLRGSPAHRAVVLDGPDSWSKALQAEGIIEKFVGLDMSDGPTVFERALEAVQRVKKARAAGVPPTRHARTAVCYPPPPLSCECRSSASWMASPVSASSPCR